MVAYLKMLEYPLNITKKDLKMAKLIASQYGGPQGELGAAIRYLNQRLTMPDDYGRSLLNDIGIEELAHIEMLQTMMMMLMKDATIEEIKAAGLENHYTEHGKDIFPENESGVSFTTDYISSTGDVIANIVEDMAAEQKARKTYDNILRLAKDQEVADPIRFLREREIVHFQRFGEALRSVQDELNSKNFYAFNPSFDAKTFCAAPQPGAGQGNCCTR